MSLTSDYFCGTIFVSCVVLWQSSCCPNDWTSDIKNKWDFNSFWISARIPYFGYPLVSPILDIRSYPLFWISARIPYFGYPFVSPVLSFTRSNNSVNSFDELTKNTHLFIKPTADITLIVHALHIWTSTSERIAIGQII